MRSVVLSLKQFGVSFHVSNFNTYTCAYCNNIARMYFSLKTKVGKVLFNTDAFRSQHNRAFCSITCFKRFCFQEMFKNRMGYHDVLEQLLNDLNPVVIVKEYETCTVKLEKGFSKDGTVILSLSPYFNKKGEDSKRDRVEMDWTVRVYVFRGQDAQDFGETLLSLVRDNVEQTTTDA